MKISILAIELSTACNLQCPYCYLRVGKDRWEMREMTDEMIEKSLNFYKKFGTGKYYIRIYGGEPFVRFGRVRKLIELAKKKGMEDVKYTLFSNGTIATPEDVKFCKDNNIGIVRGINGCREAQELGRPNTYDKYVSLYPVFGDRASGKRMTITPDNVKYLMKSIIEFADTGSPRTFPVLDYYGNWTEEKVEELKKQIKELIAYFDKRKKLKKPIWTQFVSRAFDKKIGSFCMAGKNYCCIRGDGYIYACNRFVSEPITSDFCMGHIDEVMAGREKGYGVALQDRDIKLRKEFENEKCRNCIAKKYCSKGCLHANFKVNGDIAKTIDIYCVLQKIIFNEIKKYGT